MKKVTACVSSLLLIAATGSLSHAEPILWEQNGHYYESFPGPFTWEGANADAQAKTYNGMPGHMVTLTSSEENAFVWANFPFTHYFIGGYQAPGGSEPDGGWAWVTGEPWAWTNWHGGEPNNDGGEEYLQFYYTGGGTWNDVGAWTSGYVVEYEAPLVLELGLSYGGGKLHLDYEIGTPGDSMWTNYLILTTPSVRVLPLWSMQLPAITPPRDLPTISFGFPALGWVGIATGLISAEGDPFIVIEWVNTR